MTRSAAVRSSRLRSDQLAIGAAGVPSRPASVGRARIRSRTRRAVRVGVLPLGLRVDLGDVDALRADLGADPAARAVVDRRVGRRLVLDAEALGLRAGVLRPGEQRRDVGDRAERLADRALDAVVERAAHQQAAQDVLAVVDRHRSAPRRRRGGRVRAGRRARRAPARPRGAPSPGSARRPTSRATAPRRRASRPRRARSRAAARRPRRPAAARRRRRSRRGPSGARSK